MNIDNLQSIYFLGVGGIGMSALARFFLSKGMKVAGYDRTPTRLTRQLEAEGVAIHYVDSTEQITDPFLDPAHTLVVYTPAIPLDHSELNFFRTNGYEVCKRSEVLGMLTRGGKAVCVAGTHGKTTTSSMVAHILTESGVGCTAFLGGIAKNYGSNLLLNHTTSPYIVIEADEYDRSFHHLQPYLSVITAVDPDHLDIYGSKDAYVESFKTYAHLIAEGGALIMHQGISFSPDLRKGVRLYTFAREEGDFYATHIRMGHGTLRFDYHSPLGDIADVELGVPILINVDNSIAAMALAQLCGVPDVQIKHAIKTFAGVERRFDYKIRTNDCIFLSDYAHHPVEIRQSIMSLRALYPDKRITAVFQPHLYTRTRDFYKEFAQSLSLSDEVYLLDIYPAREAPIEGISSRLIFDHLAPTVQKHLIDKETLKTIFKTRKPEVLITLGAGDIEELTTDIAEVLKPHND